ncbi:MAG: 4'-phosphopantetheinyl transferase superfamily protein [Actinomycetota bacterium]
MGEPLRHHAVGIDDVPDHDDWLTQPEADRINGFRFAKRREETRLSRWTAKQTLARALGVDRSDPAQLRRVAVRNASDGAPEAYLDGAAAPVSISMTDRADWAVCIVGDPSTSVGCDLELVEPRSQLFVEDWFTEAERRFVADRPDEHDLLANTIWSAKESALKVLRTGLRRDTRSVEVRLGAGDGRDGWAPLEVRSAEGAVFPGWWRQHDPFLLTCASTAPTAPPVSLVEPPPLATATPSHRWMERPVR